MNYVPVNIKIDEKVGGRMPVYSSEEACCFDLFSPDSVTILPGETVVINTGVALDPGPGWRIDVYPRSGLGIMRGLRLANCVGKIDSDYGGNIKVALYNDSKSKQEIFAGDRIAQAELNQVFRASFTEVNELRDTARGDGGLGSTGK